MTMMSAFDSVVNDQGLVQESQAADLIPGGSYPATLVKVEDRTASQNETFNDGKPNPLYGKPLANLQVKLECVSAKGFDELDGKQRTHFIKLCPALVYDANKKLMTPCKLAGQAIAVSGTAGKPFSETIAWLEQNKFKVTIGQFKGGDGTMRNTTYAISAL